MKKYAKGLALMAALSLCLVMTGCYIGPDDVNTNTTNPGNNVPFNTLAPVDTETATITPDTIALDTQNVWNADADSVGRDERMAAMGHGGHACGRQRNPDADSRHDRV